MAVKKIYTVIIFCLLCLPGYLTIAAAQSQKVNTSSRKFPKPSGTFNIGTHEFLWVDDSRDETLTQDKNDKRHLMVQVWYPAAQKMKGKGYPYIANPAEFGDDEKIKELLDVRTNSMLDAPVSKQLKKYPLLLFSHGMQMTRFSNTSQIEHLVSHGYIVFGIDHTFFNRSRKYPGGYQVKQDVKTTYERVKGNLPKTVQNMYTYYDDLERNTWQKDAEYVLRKIKDLNNSPKSPLYKRIDLEKIGMFGYSFGGITSMQMCGRHPEIKAGVSYDGGPIGDAWKKGITQPFLIVEPVKVKKTRREVEAAGRDYDVYLERQKVSESREKTFFEITKNINYILTITGTSHEHFNDMGLFFPAGKELLDVKLCHKILNQYTLAFFDKYLKNKNSHLLEDFPGKYKDAAFQKK